MSTIPNRRLTPLEYLAQERVAEFRSEYFNGEMFAMSGASWEHTLIKDNLAHEFKIVMGSDPCLVVTSDLRVKIDATGLYTYPDVVVVCDKPRFEDDTFDTLLNPQILVEVLSPSTERYDRGTKFAHYRKIDSLKEYILVSPDAPLIERFVRDGKNWLLTAFDGLTETFELASSPARIPLASVYRNIEFPDRDLHRSNSPSG